MEFNNSKESLFLKASLQSGFCCLSFPNQFHRARKNSVDLFPAIILKNVTEVRQFENERSFAILLGSDLSLLFKMHGNRANVVLFENRRPVEIFRNHLAADLDLNLDEMDRPLDFSKSFFENHQEKLKEVYFTFGKEVWSFLLDHGFDEYGVARRWELFEEVLEKLERPEFFIAQKKDKLVFTLLPPQKILDRFSNAMEAVTFFYSEYQKTNSFSLVKSNFVRRLESQLIASRSFLEKNRSKLEELNGDIHYQQWGDLVMAHLDQIKMGMDKVILSNFYDDNRPVEIKLKKELNAQTNAETFYRKAKNRQIEIQKLNESINVKRLEIEQIQNQLVAIEKETDLGALEVSMKGVISNQKRKEIKKSTPYHEFEFKGFKIWVGKDAKSNDELTLKYSFKDDLWLHAKDVAGSHVLVKHQAGKNFPKDVIERAAELAAYNSKRKGDSLCPVTVTPKKFVRKRKGDPVGAVIVEREDVLLVTPTL